MRRARCYVGLIVFQCETHRHVIQAAFLSKGQKRVRQHVNPLSGKYQVPIELQEGWVQAMFENPSLPFHVDIGCARGKFCMRLAETRPDVNVLGLEIRKPVAEGCIKDAEKLKLTNLGFLYANANVDLGRILQGINEVSSVSRLLIQFPDPHFKARNHKRRVVQPELVEAIAEHTSASTEVVVQSDM